MGHLLVVVSRADLRRYDFLARVFAGKSSVEVVLDRRQRSSARACHRDDRRARDISASLDRVGCVMVRR
jgi:hypothetical protein